MQNNQRMEDLGVLLSLTKPALIFHVLCVFSCFLRASSLNNTAECSTLQTRPQVHTEALTYSLCSEALHSGYILFYSRLYTHKHTLHTGRVTEYNGLSSFHVMNLRCRCWSHALPCIHHINVQTLNPRCRQRRDATATFLWTKAHKKATRVKES